jgi:hypothetical protein
MNYLQRVLLGLRAEVGGLQRFFELADVSPEVGSPSLCLCGIPSGNSVLAITGIRDDVPQENRGFFHFASLTAGTRKRQRPLVLEPRWKQSISYLRRILLGTVFFVGAPLLFAQAGLPDCAPIAFSFSGGNGISPVAPPAANAYLDNRTAGCQTWTLQYEADAGLSGFTIAFQSATGATAPASFGAYAGATVASSTSFGTAQFGVATFSGLSSTAGSSVNTPWLRVLVTGASGTGNIRGVFYGYKTGATGGTGGGGGSGGGGGGCASPCPVLGSVAVGSAAPAPVTTGFRDDSGNVLAGYGFPDQAAILVSAATDVVAVAGTSAKLTYVVSLSFSDDSAQDVTIQQGTGTTCGTSTVVLAGPYKNVAALALDFTQVGPLHTTVTGNDLCLHFGGSVTSGGLVIYGKH